MNIVMLCVADSLKQLFQAALESEGYSFSATSDPMELVRLVEQSSKPTVVVADNLKVNPAVYHVLLELRSNPAVRGCIRTIGMDVDMAYHRQLSTGLLDDFIVLPLTTTDLLDIIEANIAKLSAPSVMMQGQAKTSTCDDDACDSLASYCCKICGIALCLVHAFPQPDEDGWLCGPCFVMPKSRQEFWAAKFDAESEPLWSPLSENYVPDYAGDGLDFDEDPYDLRDKEPDMIPWGERSDEDEEGESEDLLDHLEEDSDGPTINTWALARAAVDGDYETDDWQAQELERDLYDDDYDGVYDDADDDYEAY